MDVAHLPFVSMPFCPREGSSASSLRLDHPLWGDWVMRIAFLVVGLLLAYQLAVTLLQPDWADPVTDWLRTGVAWLQLFGLVVVSNWLTRVRSSGALTWWMISAGMLTYTIAQTWWVSLDTFISPDRIPVPGWTDLFFLLQYPFFFLALVCWPSLPAFSQAAMTRLKVILDCLLLMGAATALSWYFILAPLYHQSTQSMLGKITNLAYPVGDLGVLFGLIIVAFTRHPLDRGVLRLLILAVACLALADSWFSYVDLSTIYLTGGPPDFFWLSSYLFFLLAGLAKFRLTQQERMRQSEAIEERQSSETTPRQGVMGSVHFPLPFVAALLAGVVIAVRAITTPIETKSSILPLVISIGLLVLVVARQHITLLENARLQHERETAQANELAMREANRRMEAFLGVAGYELKTPLTTLQLSLQWMRRRGEQQGTIGVEAARLDKGIVEVPRRELHRALEQQERLNRLVNDLLDTSRIQTGRLDLDLRRADLVEIVRARVEEQRQMFPERHIILHMPEGPVFVSADAARISQVVTNYLTNALKYSREDRPVEVGVGEERQQGRVWVRDQGPGISPDAQELLWERFHRVPGIEVQSGSGIGLGLGLHISKTIIEHHQGKVGVQSSPGHGSTFWFALPLVTSAREGEQRGREPSNRL